MHGPVDEERSRRAALPRSDARAEHEASPSIAIPDLAAHRGPVPRELLTQLQRTVGNAVTSRFADEHAVVQRTTATANGGVFDNAPGYAARGGTGAVGSRVGADILARLHPERPRRDAGRRNQPDPDRAWGDQPGAGQDHPGPRSAERQHRGQRQPRRHPAGRPRWCRGRHADAPAGPERRQPQPRLRRGLDRTGHVEHPRRRRADPGPHPARCARARPDHRAVGAAGARHRWRTGPVEPSRSRTRPSR